MRMVHKRDDDIYEIIATNIRNYRKEAKMTQGELALKSNYSHEYIRRIEAPNSKKYISINTLVKLAEALEIDVELLLKGISNGDE